MTDKQQQLNILNVQQILVCFNGLKSEINKLCKNGEYDIDSFQKVVIDMNVVQKAIENLDQCQNALLAIAKSNSNTQPPNQSFDPNSYQDLKVTPKIYEP